MLLIRADHAHDASTAHDLALVANPFDRRSDLHDCNPLSSSRVPGWSPHHRHDSPTSQILRRQLQTHAIANQYPDEIAARPAWRVRDDVTRPLNLHAVLRIRQRLSDDAFHRNRSTLDVARILVHLRSLPGWLP